MYRTIKEALTAKKSGIAPLPVVPSLHAMLPQGKLALIQEYTTKEYAFVVAYPFDGRIQSPRGVIVKTFTA